MFSQRPFAQDSRPYAIPADFCRIFEHDMNRLYLLSYLLTADHRMAETCFVRGLEDATRSNRVFREWAGSWARRMIIQDAIQTVRPLASNDTVSTRVRTKFQMSRGRSQPSWGSQHSSVSYL